MTHLAKRHDRMTKYYRDESLKERIKAFYVKLKAFAVKHKRAIAGVGLGSAFSIAIAIMTINYKKGLRKANEALVKARVDLLRQYSSEYQKFIGEAEKLRNESERLLKDELAQKESEINRLSKKIEKLSKTNTGPKGTTKNGTGVNKGAGVSRKTNKK